MPEIVRRLNHNFMFGSRALRPRLSSPANGFNALILLHNLSIKRPAGFSPIKLTFHSKEITVEKWNELRI